MQKKGDHSTPDRGKRAWGRMLHLEQAAATAHAEDHASMRTTPTDQHLAAMQTPVRDWQTGEEHR